MDKSPANTGFDQTTLDLLYKKIYNKQNLIMIIDKIYVWLF